jgi:hypothetical protein
MLLWCLRTQRSKSRANCRAGSNSVVDDNDRASRDIGLRAAPKIVFAAAFDLGEFMVADRIEFRLRNAGVTNYVRVTHYDRVYAARHRAHGQLRLSGNPNLPDQNEIKRRAESGSDFGRDWHAAARQRQNYWRALLILSKRRGQAAASGDTIFEGHCATPRPALSTRGV